MELAQGHTVSGGQGRLKAESPVAQIRTLCRAPLHSVGLDF